MLTWQHRPDLVCGIPVNNQVCVYLGGGGWGTIIGNNNKKKNWWEKKTAFEALGRPCGIIWSFVPLCILYTGYIHTTRKVVWLNFTFISFQLHSFRTCSSSARSHFNLPAPLYLCNNWYALKKKRRYVLFLSPHPPPNHLPPHGTSCAQHCYLIKWCSREIIVSYSATVPSQFPLAVWHLFVVPRLINQRKIKLGFGLAAQRIKKLLLRSPSPADFNWVIDVVSWTLVLPVSGQVIRYRDTLLVSVSMRFLTWRSHLDIHTVGIRMIAYVENSSFALAEEEKSGWMR